MSIGAVSLVGMVTFGWPEEPIGQPSLVNQTIDSLTATVAGWRQKKGQWEEVGVASRSGKTWSGIGVNSGRRDSSAVDGEGRSEMLRVEFSSPVLVHNVRFLDDDIDYKFGGNNEVDIFTDGQLFSDNVKLKDTSGKGKTMDDSEGWLVLDQSLTTLWLRANESSDHLYLSGLQASVSKSTAVPEPGTLGLIGLGLLGLAVGSSRQRVSGES